MDYVAEGNCGVCGRGAKVSYGAKENEWQQMALFFPFFFLEVVKKRALNHRVQTTRMNMEKDSNEMQKNNGMIL